MATIRLDGPQIDPAISDPQGGGAEYYASAVPRGTEPLTEDAAMSRFTATRTGAAVLLAASAALDAGGLTSLAPVRPEPPATGYTGPRSPLSGSRRTCRWRRPTWARRRCPTIRRCARRRCGCWPVTGRCSPARPTTRSSSTWACPTCCKAGPVRDRQRHVARLQRADHCAPQCGRSIRAGPVNLNLPHCRQPADFLRRAKGEVRQGLPKRCCPARRCASTGLTE